MEANLSSIAEKLKDVEYASVDWTAYLREHLNHEDEVNFNMIKMAKIIFHRILNLHGFVPKSVEPVPDFILNNELGVIGYKSTLVDFDINVIVNSINDLVLICLVSIDRLHPRYNILVYISSEEVCYFLNNSAINRQKVLENIHEQLKTFIENRDVWFADHSEETI